MRSRSWLRIARVPISLFTASPCVFPISRPLASGYLFNTFIQVLCSCCYRVHGRCRLSREIPGPARRRCPAYGYPSPEGKIYPCPSLIEPHLTLSNRFAGVTTPLSLSGHCENASRLSVRSSKTPTVFAKLQTNPTTTPYRKQSRAAS